MLSIASTLKKLCLSFAEKNGITEPLAFEVDLTKDIAKGDLCTNLPFVLASKMGKNPIAIAMDLQNYLEEKIDKTDIENMEVAGGYVNFWINASLQEIPKNIPHPNFSKKKIIYDYTDPNPMKEFHIGHLMSNTVGECLSRLGELAGAKIKRYSYQGDVGRHIAMTIWGLQFMEAPWPDDEKITLTEKVKYLGSAYVAGNQKLAHLKENGEESEEYKKALTEIESINKQVYDRTDAEINTVYDQGREWSLQKFEELYDILGTKFDAYFFESEAGPVGLKIIQKHPDVFVSGESGAIIFEGEKYDLHTRVFVNKHGLPTYEGKEVGLTKLKWDMWPFDQSFVITANEQNEVFKVTKQAITLVMPDIGPRLEHFGHGTMKFVGQKMSSRTGKIIAGDALVEQMMEASFEKMKERDISEDKKKEIARDVAVAAIKFTILKQNSRKDIIFDPEKALSLEGDSGPYIQYAAVRISSLLKKVDEALSNRATEVVDVLSPETLLLKRSLMRFDHVCYQAIDEMAPQHIAQYLIELSSRFNSFYMHTKIIHIDTEGKTTVNPELASICKYTFDVLQKGLEILGIRTVDQM